MSSKVTVRDLLTLEAAELTPIAARWGRLAERAKAKATKGEDPEETPRLWVIATTFTAGAWMLLSIHNLLTDAARHVGP